MTGSCLQSAGGERRTRSHKKRPVYRKEGGFPTASSINVSSSLHDRRHGLTCVRSSHQRRHSLPRDQARPFGIFRGVDDVGHIISSLYEPQSSLRLPSKDNTKRRNPNSSEKTPSSFYKANTSGRLQTTVRSFSSTLHRTSKTRGTPELERTSSCLEQDVGGNIKNIQAGMKKQNSSQAFRKQGAQVESSTDSCKSTLSELSDIENEKERDNSLTTELTPYVRQILRDQIESRTAEASLSERNQDYQHVKNNGKTSSSRKDLHEITISYTDIGSHHDRNDGRNVGNENTRNSYDTNTNNNRIDAGRESDDEGDASDFLLDNFDCYDDYADEESSDKQTRDEDDYCGSYDDDESSDESDCSEEEDEDTDENEDGDDPDDAEDGNNNHDDGRNGEDDRDADNNDGNNCSDEDGPSHSYGDRDAGGSGGGNDRNRVEGSQSGAKNYTDYAGRVHYHRGGGRTKKNKDEDGNINTNENGSSSDETESDDSSSEIKEQKRETSSEDETDESEDENAKDNDLEVTTKARVKSDANISHDANKAKTSLKTTEKEQKADTDGAEKAEPTSTAASSRFKNLKKRFKIKRSQNLKGKEVELSSEVENGESNDIDDNEESSGKKTKRTFKSFPRSLLFSFPRRRNRSTKSSTPEEENSEDHGYCEPEQTDGRALIDVNEDRRFDRNRGRSSSKLRKNRLHLGTKSKEGIPENDDVEPDTSKGKGDGITQSSKSVGQNTQSPTEEASVTGKSSRIKTKELRDKAVQSKSKKKGKQNLKRRNKSANSNKRTVTSVTGRRYSPLDEGHLRTRQDSFPRGLEEMGNKKPGKRGWFGFLRGRFNDKNSQGLQVITPGPCALVDNVVGDRAEIGPVEGKNLSLMILTVCVCMLNVAEI